MKNITVDEALFLNLQSEMRRGNLVLTTLIHLEKPNYGYGLLKILRDSGQEISQDTLYPLLRRLESQGLLQGDWDTETKRPRKIYQVTAKARPLRDRLIQEWRKQKDIMEAIL